jgi:hypothetical protein
MVIFYAFLALTRDLITFLPPFNARGGKLTLFLVQVVAME